MNPLLTMLSGGGSNGYMQILMKAVGAAMRGESPESFMTDLAKTNPQLRGLDMTNLEATAQDLANKKGVDLNALAESVKSSVNKLV